MLLEQLPPTCKTQTTAHRDHSTASVAPMFGRIAPPETRVVRVRSRRGVELELFECGVRISDFFRISEVEFRISRTFVAGFSPLTSDTRSIWTRFLNITNATGSHHVLALAGRRAGGGLAGLRQLCPAVMFDGHTDRHRAAGHSRRGIRRHRRMRGLSRRDSRSLWRQPARADSDWPSGPCRRRWVRIVPWPGQQTHRFRRPARVHHQSAAQSVRLFSMPLQQSRGVPAPHRHPVLEGIMNCRLP
jgi:hypothetical protein